MSDVILLEGKAEGDRLLLAAGGSWTALHALELETLIEAQAETPSEFRRVDIDMGRIERLDTFGAWLLERLVRAWKGRGAETTVLRLAANYQPLIDEVRQRRPRVEDAGR